MPPREPAAMKDASPGPLPPSRPPAPGLSPAGPARQTFILDTYRMSRSVPFALPEGHEVACVLAWKPAHKADDWDVTMLVQVTG